jgi:hypothetical protein
MFFDANSLRIWLVTEAIIDLGIAAALLWELRKARGIMIERRRYGTWQSYFSTWLLTH